MRQALAEKWVEELGYRELVTFTTTDAAGSAVYHTNVMMAVGSDVAVVCAEAVPDDKERRHLLASLRKHHEVGPRLSAQFIFRPGRGKVLGSRREIVSSCFPNWLQSGLYAAGLDAPNPQDFNKIFSTDSFNRFVQ